MFNVERYAYFEFIKLKSYLKTLVKVMFIRMFYTVQILYLLESSIYNS